MLEATFIPFLLSLRIIQMVILGVTARSFDPMRCRLYSCKAFYKFGFVTMARIKFSNGPWCRGDFQILFKKWLACQSIRSASSFKVREGSTYESRVKVP